MAECECGGGFNVALHLTKSLCPVSRPSIFGRRITAPGGVRCYMDPACIKLHAFRLSPPRHPGLFLCPAGRALEHGETSAIRFANEKLRNISACTPNRLVSFVQTASGQRSTSMTSSAQTLYQPTKSLQISCPSKLSESGVRSLLARCRGEGLPGVYQARTRELSLPAERPWL